MKSVWPPGALALLLCIPALADQWNVVFEGDSMPESLPGWERQYSTQYGGAARWVETDGSGNSYLVIDSLASPWIYDYVLYSRELAPDIGSRFYAEWRILVSQNYTSVEHGMAFAPDYGGFLDFSYAYDYVLVTPGDFFLYVDGGQFHTYRIESEDMIHYDLWLDGAWVHSGEWFDGYGYSSVAFGDGGAGPGGGRSITKWDYVRFGVVPEVGTLGMGVLVGMCACGGRRRL